MSNADKMRALAHYQGVLTAIDREFAAAHAFWSSANRYGIAVGVTGLVRR